FGALQINCDNGVFAEVLRQYAIRPDLRPGQGEFSDEQLQRATNQVGIVFAACILDETGIQGAPNPGQGRLPDIQDIGLGGLLGEAGPDEATRERRIVPRCALRSPALRDMNWGQGHRLRRLAWTCTLLVVIACMSGQWPQAQHADWEPLAIDAYPLPGRWM